MSRHAKRRLHAAEFEAVRPLLNISEERIEAARLALVDGLTFQSIGRRYGWSKQAVGDTVNVVWKRMNDYHAAQQAAASAAGVLPSGWEQVTLIAPAELASRFRREAAEAQACFRARDKPSKGEP